MRRSAAGDRGLSSPRVGMSEPRRKVGLILAVALAAMLALSLPPSASIKAGTSAPSASSAGPPARTPSISGPADAGPAVASAPNFTILAELSDSPQGWDNAHFYVNFSVPSGISHVLYVWAYSGNFSVYQSPILPSGLSIVTSIVRTGMAFGALAPGNYSTDLTYNGWVNFASIVVYGISQDANDSYRFYSARNTGLALPSGAVDYHGVESTGGTYAVTNSSIAQVDDEAWAMYGGPTGIIGRQSSGNFTFSTAAVWYGMAAVGIYPSVSRATYTVNFTESGLAERELATTGWSVSLNGNLEHSNSTTITFLGIPVGAYSVLVIAKGFNSNAAGTLAVFGPTDVSVVFTPDDSGVLRIHVKAFPGGTPLCVSVDGYARCTLIPGLTIPGISFGAFPYVREVATTAARSAAIGIADVLRASSVSLGANRALVKLVY